MDPRLSAACLLALAACSAPAPQGSASATAAQTGGARPPDFELPALDGSRVRLSDHLGRDVVLIDFWATFCEPCLRAMPHLDALYTKYEPRGFVVLGISIDGADSLPEVRTEVQKLGVRFPILLDQDTRVVALYNPKTSAPFSVLIDRGGHVRVKREGYTTGAAEVLEKDVTSLLEDGAGPSSGRVPQNRNVASSRAPSNGG